MDDSEYNIHSFIVKIWLEEAAQRASRARWRGHIIHVPDGERRYFNDPDDILGFVASYLDEVGARPSLQWRVRHWLNRWKRYLKRL